MQLQRHLADFRKAGADLLAIHVECPPEGTRILARKMNFDFPLANDDRLGIVDRYSVTSTYLIDTQGIIRARWLDEIHRRVDGPAILAAVKELQRK